MKRPPPMRRHRTLLVSELHPFTAPLYWLLSWHVRIQVLYTHPACRWLLGRRISPLDVTQHLSSEEGWTVCARAVTRWEAIARHIPAAPWRVTYRGCALDFSEKGKQELGRAHEEFLLLGEIQARGQPREALHVLHSGQSAWVARVDRSGRAEPQPASLSRISGAGIFLDTAWMRCVNAGRIVRLFLWLLQGLGRRLVPSRQAIGRRRYLYWCDSEADVSRSSEKRSFTWIMDGQSIREADVLVLLPSAMDAASIRQWQQTPDQRACHVFTFPQLYARIPARYLVAAIRDLVRLAIRSLLSPRFEMEQVLITRYLTDVIRMRPIVQEVRPSWYVESDSSLGFEDPAIVYCDRLGIRTVMYQTSAILPVAYQRLGLAARDVMHAHILASTVVCWSREAKRFLEAHPQGAGQDVMVCGPILPGDDSVLQRGAEELRRRYGHTQGHARGGLKYVAVFETSPFIGAAAPSRSVRPYPHPFTEEYTIRFLRDMLQLLSAFEGVVVVYKPKRNDAMESRFPTRLAEYRQVLKTLQCHERGIVFAHDINPWIPITMADLCISLLGGSPPWAALHHGIPGFFHNAGYPMEGGDVPSMQGYLTHGYESLVVKVRQLLYESEDGRQHRLRSGVVGEFLGSCPGTNSNAVFRHWLAGAQAE